MINFGRNRKVIPLQRYYDELNEEHAWWNRDERSTEDQSVDYSYEVDSSTWDITEDIQYIQHIYKYTNNNLSQYGVSI